MNKLETVAAPDLPSADRASEMALAAPSRSEHSETMVTAISKAFYRLCEAANSSDHRGAQAAMTAAADILGISDNETGVDIAVAETHSALVSGSQYATRRQVANAVANLIGAFPNFGSKAESRLFGAQLAEEVASAEPSVMALSMMTRAVRRKSKFVPTIMEVREELYGASRSISEGWFVVSHFRDRWERARQNVEKLVARHEEWLATQVAEYRAALSRGDNDRRFPEEIVAAATRQDDNIPF